MIIPSFELANKLKPFTIFVIAKMVQVSKWILTTKLALMIIIIQLFAIDRH